MRTYSSVLKTAAGITLFIFCWTYGPLYAAVAWAATDSPKSSVNSQKSSTKDSRLTTHDLFSAERFERALEDIRETIGRAEEKSAKGEDDSSERAAIRAKKSEVDSLADELRNGFSETERKLNAAGLPKEILTRHSNFVAHFERNIKELRANLNDIDAARTPADRKVKIEKARLHLEKTKKPSRYVPLNPNQLPFRTTKAKPREPRLKKEDFERDFPKQKSRSKQKVADIHLLPDFIASRVQQKPVLLAFNETASDIPFSLSVQSSTPQFAFSDTAPLLLAQAAQYDLPTADDLAESAEVQFTPELRQIATLLENNPVQLFEFVRNNFTYDQYYGSVKGSQGTLLLQNGNDFDQASVLIALFRVSGIPARYAYGTVEIPIEKVMKWLGGITDPRTAGMVLATNGIPAKLIISGGAIKSVLLEKVWTEVYIPYANYRGLINDPTAPKTWIPLDPSFKLTDANPNAVDMADLQQFDIDSYFASYLQTVKPTTPAKDYLTTTINYVTNNLPGQRFYDLLASGPIIDKVLGLLPDTLSYPVRTKGATFSTIPDSYRHRIALEFTDPNTNETVLSYSASWASLLHNRFTISYIPATTIDEQTIATYGDIYSTPPYLIKVKPVLKVEGTTVAEGSAVGMAGDLIFKMDFYGPRGVLDNVETNILTVGATHAIGLGSGYTTGRIITYRTAKLEAAAIAGETGDPIIGEYLNLLAMNYLQELDSSRKLISKSMKILDTYRTTELMVGVNLGVAYIFSIPRRVDIKGLLIDVDYNVATPVDMDGNQSKVRKFQILGGMTSSSLEHTMFEAIVGVEAVSSIKALQVASVQGIPIHQIDSTNVSAKLPVLQLSSEVKTDIQNAVQAGKVVTVSERNIQLNNWNGVGYVVLDPTTGSGAFMISSGLSGGSLTQMTSTLQNWIKGGHLTVNDATQIIIAHKCVIWFPQPVDGPITSGYNAPRSYGIHGAVDIAVPNWTPVQAVAAGKVIKAEYADAYTSSTGYYVIIDHGAGVTTRYLHNCQINVQENQNVKEGDTIALAGNTGHIESRYVSDPSTYIRCQGDSHYGSHVHFELRLNGEKVDPALYGKWGSSCGSSN